LERGALVAFLLRLEVWGAALGILHGKGRVGIQSEEAAQSSRQMRVEIPIIHHLTDDKGKPSV
jgi:hypothetical protein